MIIIWLKMNINKIVFDQKYELYINPGQCSMDYGHYNLICTKKYHCNETLIKNFDYQYI